MHKIHNTNSSSYQSTCLIKMSTSKINNNNNNRNNNNDNNSNGK